jgi:hypothetical protein
VSNWQPIETAPTDGTPVLVCNEERDGAWIAYYCPVYVSGYRPDDPWSSLMLNMRWHKNKWASTVPTKWMPLPDVPGKETAVVPKGPTIDLDRYVDRYCAKCERLLPTHWRHAICSTCPQ